MLCTDIDVYPHSKLVEQIDVDAMERLTKCDDI